MTLNLRDDTDLSRLLGVHVNGRRLFFWFQQKIEFKAIYWGRALTKSHREVLDVLFHTIKSDKNLLKSLKIQASNTLLQDKDIEFFKKNKRFVEWVRVCIDRNMSFVGQLNSQESMNSLDYVLAKIDILDASLAQKNDFILRLKSDWENYLDQDGITRWLHDKNESAVCEHARECIARGYPVIPRPERGISNKTDLLTFLDMANIDRYERMNLIAKIKNGWNQKKYREKQKGKKQCNLLLSQKGIDRLEKFSKKYDLGKSEIIEILLLMEEKEKHYIKKRLFILEHAAEDYLAERNETEDIDQTLPVSATPEESNVEQAIVARNNEANQPPDLSVGDDEPF